MASLIDLVGRRPVFDGRPEDRNYEHKMLEHQQELNTFNSTVQRALYSITEQAATERELNKARHEAIMETARKFGG